MSVITKFISGLNDNQKRLLVIAVVIVIAALFDRLLIAPTMSRLSSIENDIAKEEVTIKQESSFLYCSAFTFKSATSIFPLSSHFTTITFMPAIAADAGFVPCADDGINAMLR